MFVQALPALSFGEAIKNCFTKYCTFSGRSRRSEFWLFYIFVQIIMAIITLLFFFIFFFIIAQNIKEFNDKTNIDIYNSDYQRRNISLGPGFFVLLMIALFITFILTIPVISASVRRLHDTGRSGCYLLLCLVPFGSIILLIFFIEDSQQKTNQYGSSPKYVIIQGDPLMDLSMSISVSGIPNVNPNFVFAQRYVQPNPYPYPVQQYVQYPPQNIQIPQQQNLYQGNVQYVQEVAPNNQEQLATPMAVP